MTRLFYLIYKDFLLLIRDWHAMAALFLMPSIFIVIMSLALQDTIEGRFRPIFNILIINQDQGPDSREIENKIHEFEIFNIQKTDNLPGQLDKKISANGFHFALVIPKNYSQSIEREFKDNRPSSLKIQVFAAPDVPATSVMMFESRINEMMMSIMMNRLNDRLNRAFGGNRFELTKRFEGRRVSVQSVSPRDEKIPSSVQQSVPAWIIFSMFFIIIPASTVILAERKRGTLSRLYTMNVHPYLLLIGKLFPYFAVNQIQLVLMIAVGIWVVPIFGGDQLNHPSSYSALALISTAASLASIGTAFLIASFSTSVEQATIIGGIGNIIMGALGGVMVPRFVMPPALRSISDFSPMSWGLEGFLDIFLRDGNLCAVLPEAGLLFALGAVMLVLSAIRFNYIKGDRS